MVVSSITSFFSFILGEALIFRENKASAEAITKKASSNLRINDKQLLAYLIGIWLQSPVLLQVKCTYVSALNGRGFERNCLFSNQSRDIVSSSIQARLL